MAYDDIANCPRRIHSRRGSYDTPKGFYRITATTLNGTQFTLRADAKVHRRATPTAHGCNWIRRAIARRQPAGDVLLKESFRLALAQHADRRRLR
jgi:hypothetical protein